MPAPNLKLRFDKYLATTSIEGDCWLWHGKKDRHGYGRVTIDGKSTGIHRAIYEFLIGEIPNGLVLDHLCRVPNCVNPLHLEPVSSRENTLRGLKSLKIGNKCLNGHLIEDSTDIISVARKHRDGGYGNRCRKCLLESEKRRYIL